MILLTAKVSVQTLDALESGEGDMRKVKLTRRMARVNHDGENWRDNEFLQLIDELAEEGRRITNDWEVDEDDEEDDEEDGSRDYDYYFFNDGDGSDSDSDSSEDGAVMVECHTDSDSGADSDSTVR